MRRARGGHVLIQLLLISTLLFLLASSFLATSSFHSYSVSRRTELYRARLAAESAIQEALIRLTDDPDWTGSLEGDPSQAAYRLDFRDSVNNLASPFSVPGYAGRVVPPYSALLVGHGRAGGGARATVLALVSYRGFPYAVAASNGVSATNRLEVLGAGSLADLAAGKLSQPAGILMPAPGENMVAGSGSLVTGSILVGSGAPILGPGTVVKHGVRQGAQASMVPNLDLEHFDNGHFEGLTELLPGAYGPLELEGPVRVKGSLQASGVTLKNAYVYVDGDLNVNGVLKGEGSFYVSGRTTLRGNQTLVGGTRIAVFSQGRLWVGGAAFYQGLLYSHDSVVTGAGMNVIGAVVAQAPSGLPEGGRVELGPNSRIVYVRELADFGAASSDSTELQIICWSYMP